MKMIPRLWVLSALVFSFCSRAQNDTHSINRLKPCNAAQGPSDTYCGHVTVWENRDARSGRQIALNVSVLPSLKQKKAADPLFFLAGGPGQAATTFARAFQEEFRPIETDRDIVLVDQRGTGKSNPLECKAAADEGAQDDPQAAYVSRMRACLASYAGKADVTKYTTEIAMDDLDDVRKFLGYSKIDLYGVSYGTRAAMVYARRHADHTRAVILDGAAPVEMRIPLYLARDSQRALDLLFRDCEQDSICKKRFPNLRTRLPALLDKLAAHPQHFHYADPRTGLDRERTIQRSTVAHAIRASLYSPMTAATVPLMIEEGEKGNFSGFLALSAAFGPLSETVAQGMQASVLCSEDASQIAPGAVAKESMGTFTGAELAETFLKPCEFWPRRQMDASYFSRPSFNLPALILSGELDPVTPPSWGNEVAAQWKGSRHIVVPAAGHNTSADGCVMRLMADFLNRGNASEIDASCVKRLKRPPFLVGPSGPDPMTEVTH